MQYLYKGNGQTLPLPRVITGVTVWNWLWLALQLLETPWDKAGGKCISQINDPGCRVGRATTKVALDFETN